MDGPTYKVIQTLLQRVDVSKSESPLRSLADLLSAVEQISKSENTQTASSVEHEIPIVFDSHVCNCCDHEDDESVKIINAIEERNRKLTLIVTKIFELPKDYADRIISVLMLRPMDHPLVINYNDMHSIISTICPDLSDTKRMNLANAFAACL